MRNTKEAQKGYGFEIKRTSRVHCPAPPTPTLVAGATTKVSTADRPFRPRSHSLLASMASIFPRIFCPPPLCPPESRGVPSSPSFASREYIYIYTHVCAHVYRYREPKEEERRKESGFKGGGKGLKILGKSVGRAIKLKVRPDGSVDASLEADIPCGLGIYPQKVSYISAKSRCWWLQGGRCRGHFVN